MAPGNPPPTKPELSLEAFAELAGKLDAHIDSASSQNIKTSISIQNGFHFKSQFGDHEIVHLGKQEETFAASHAKLAVVAFKVAQGSIDKDTHRDLISMLRISDNGAFKRQKRDVAPDVVAFAKSELGLDTDILTIRDDGTSYAGLTTACDSLKMFLKTIQLARKNAELIDDNEKLSNDINDALSSNTSKYGVRARLTPYTGLYLLNKTGDYFGHNDPEIGEAVHHDVGILRYKTGKEKRRLAYSITSSADSWLGALNADRLNQQAAAILIEAIGGTPKSALKATLGTVASKLLSK